MNELNISILLTNFVLYLVKNFNHFHHIRGNQIGCSITKDIKITKTARIVGKFKDKTQTEPYFSHNKYYILYFNWPGYFNLNLENKVGTIFSLLICIPDCFDGTLLEKFVHFKKIPEFQQWFLENKKKINEKFKELEYSLQQLENKFEITGDIYSFPER